VHLVGSYNTVTFGVRLWYRVMTEP